MGETSPRKKRHRIVNFIVILLLLALLSGVIYDTYFGKGILKSIVQETMAKGQEGKETEEKAELNLSNESKSSFAAYGKGFLQSTKDGVKYYTDIKTQKWNDTYTMTSPTMISEGNYAAVVELLGRTAYVYDDKGLQYQVQTDSPIVQMALNANGYLVVITNDKIRYQIIAYDNTGIKLATRIDEPKGVYPMSADISDDNRILAISYLDTTDIRSNSKILFFYLNNEEGKKFVDQLYAGVEKKGEIVPFIAFSKDNKLFGASDGSVMMIDDTGKEVWNKKASNKLMYTAIGKNNFLAVAWGDVLSGKEGVPTGTVEWYNQKGELLGSFFAKDSIKYLKVWNDITIIGAGKTYYALTTAGKIIWEYHAVEDIIDILPLNNQNTVLYVTQTKAVIKNIAEENAKKEKAESVKNDPAETKTDAHTGDTTAEPEDDGEETSKDKQGEPTENTQKPTAPENENNMGAE